MDPILVSVSDSIIVVGVGKQEDKVSLSLGDKALTKVVDVKGFNKKFRVDF